MVKKILVLTTVIILWFAFPIFAEVKNVQSLGTCVFSKECNLEIARYEALLDAKRRALEKLGVNLDSYKGDLSGLDTSQQSINHLIGSVQVVDGTLESTIYTLKSGYQKVAVKGVFRLEDSKISTSKPNMKRKGFMGISVKLLDFIQVKGANSLPAGLLITEVYPNSPAAISGLKKNDIILEYNKQQIKPSFLITRLTKAIEETTPGNLMTLKILRGENVKIVKVCVGEKFEIIKRSGD